MFLNYIAISLVSLIVFIFSSGCSSSLLALKKQVGGEDVIKEEARLSREEAKRQKSQLKIKSRDNVNIYEEEVAFDDSSLKKRKSYNPLDDQPTFSGSLWQNSGQQNYLFSKNLEKNIGDLLTVNLEENTKKQLSDEYEAIYVNESTDNQRSKYIKKLLKEKDSFSRAEVKKLLKKSAQYSEKLTKQNKAPKDSKKRILNSDEITARVVDVLSNGSYKIQGVQRLVISKKPYKMILAGLIRSSDISPDDSVNSGKMVDTKINFVREEL